MWIECNAGTVSIFHMNVVKSMNLEISEVHEISDAFLGQKSPISPASYNSERRVWSGLLGFQEKFIP